MPPCNKSKNLLYLNLTMFVCQATMHSAEEKKVDLFDSSTWSRLHYKISIIKTRLKNCPKMGFARWICSDCQQVQEQSKPYRLTCSMRYCKDLHCVKSRIWKNKLRLHNLKISSKRLIHLVIGFPYVNRLNKALKTAQESILRQITKEMKRLGTPLNAIRIFDISEKEGEYYLHYHFALLPSKDYMKFKQNFDQVRKKYKVIVRMIGWRPIKSLFNYFAQRMAGQYGHKATGTDFYLSDIMSVKEYVQNFFNIRSYNLIGDFPRAKRGNLVNIFLSRPEKCAYCGSTRLRLLPESYIQTLGDPPPNHFEQYVHEQAEKFRRSHPKVRKIQYESEESKTGFEHLEPEMQKVR